MLESHKCYVYIFLCNFQFFFGISNHFIVCQVFCVYLPSFIYKHLERRVTSSSLYQIIYQFWFIFRDFLEHFCTTLIQTDCSLTVAQLFFWLSFHYHCGSFMYFLLGLLSEFHVSCFFWWCSFILMKFSLCFSRSIQI